MQWKVIYENYRVSDTGLVETKVQTGRWKPMLCRPNLRGYPSVWLRIDGAKKQFTVHLLVATNFIGPRPDGMECRHLDGKKLNCNVSNLAWGTRKENWEDSRRHGVTRSSKRRYITHAGLTLTMSRWAKVLGISRECLRQRLERQPILRALSVVDIRAKRALD